jgi:hypothetical protein
MKIKLLKAYGTFVKGAVVEFSTPIAEELIKRGVAEKVKPIPTNKKLQKQSNDPLF